ncbi:MAG: SoxR reducing system RseC family protein [Gammaproteobacteria bacterium]|nr:SoxR reducing system RseC family protein [Gammaproteobacteria bacterium]
MIEETARVVAAEGEFVWVETQRQSTCGGCAARQGCGTATLAKVLGRRRTRVRALNRDAARVGDRVVVGIDEQALVRGSLAVYAVPLLGLLAGGVLGALVQTRLQLAGEALTLIAGVAGLIAGLLWVKGFTRRIRGDSRYQPVVLRRLAG